MPLKVLVAVMDGTHLPIRNHQGLWTTVHLRAGDMLVWEASVVHYGPAYATKHYRVHTDVHTAGFRPSLSALYPGLPRQHDV